MGYIVHVMQFRVSVWSSAAATFNAHALCQQSRRPLPKKFATDNNQEEADYAVVQLRLGSLYQAALMINSGESIFKFLRYSSLALASMFAWV